MNDLSSEARTLLDKAEGGDDPNLEDRQRVWRALGPGVAAGAAGAAALGGTARVAAASTKAALGAGSISPVAVPMSKLAAWLAIGVVGGLGTTGVALFASGRTEPPVAVAPSPVVGARAPLGDDSPRVLTAPAEIPLAPAPVEANTGSVAPPLLVPSANRPAPTKPVAEPATATSLGAETSLLESARAALGRGDARGALTLLEAHERAFPEGALVEERLASKVFALCGLGRTTDARRVATEFLERAPGSPLRARVQGSCGFLL
ncbi:MAG TPA: hypothetical protein VF395_08840 [Polyangiaceae bacterium]